MKKIDERKAQICLNTILDLIKDSKVSNNSKNNYERLKLNLHVLTYTENDKTMKYLE